MNECPACSSQEYTELGTLGNKTWYRCSHCGTDFTLGVDFKNQPEQESGS